MSMRRPVLPREPASPSRWHGEDRSSPILEQPKEGASWCRPDRNGVALFVVIGFLAFVTIVALYLHSFSRRQMAQTRQHSRIEVAWRAATLAARQADLLLERATEFLNSTDPSTWPKRDKAPLPLRPLIEAITERDGRLRGADTLWELPLDHTPLRPLLEEEPHLGVTVTIALRGVQPLLDEPAVPGLSEPPAEWRGRFVIEARATLDEVERRVMTKREFRWVSLQWPVVGRFVLTALRGSGQPNPLRVEPPAPGRGSPRFPPDLRPAPGVQPLTIMGGPPVTDRAGVARDPASYLDRQGWIYLGNPPPSPSDFWTLGAALGLGDTGEGFPADHRPWFFEIPQGASRLGMGQGPTALWPRFESVVFACVPYGQSRERANQYALHTCPGDLDTYSHLRLMGTSREPSPTLVFGPVFRRYLLEQGIRPRPRFPNDLPPVALIPFVRPEDYNRPDFGVPGLDRRVPDILRAACAGYDGFRLAMSALVIAPANEALAFALNQASPAQLKPQFRTAEIPKLGRDLMFDPARPDRLLLDGPCRLLRGGQTVFEGSLGHALANLNTLALARAARVFPDGARLRTWLEGRLARGRSVTGVYEVSGPFTWTDEWNTLALGGVVVVAHGDITIRAGVMPRSRAVLPDAVDHPVTLYSKDGNIILATNQPVQAALVAPRGQLRGPADGEVDLRGLVAVGELPLDQFKTGRPKTIRYDARHDWADPAAYDRSFRLQLEEQNLFFAVKPR